MQSARRRRAATLQIRRSREAAPWKNALALKVLIQLIAKRAGAQNSRRSRAHFAISKLCSVWFALDLCAGHKCKFRIPSTLSTVKLQLKLIKSLKGSI